jgi:hypothetical protein
MGYRSDVAYKIKFDDEGQWNVFLLEAKSKPETRACFEDEDLTVVHEEREIRFSACAVKWYPDYPDVKCHHILMELCDEYNERQEKNFVDGGTTNIKEPVVSYLFRRIGEEEDDIEHQCGGDPDWDWIELNRSLQVNW